MTREQLEKSLAKIGWRIEKSHNELNDFIINNLNERTNFVIYGYRLEIRCNLFGETSFCGDVNFNITEIEIKEGNLLEGTYKGENPTENNKNNVDYVSLHFKNKCFILFYKRNK